MSRLICEWDLGDLHSFNMGDSLVCRLPEEARKAAQDIDDHEGYFAMALIYKPLDERRMPLGATLQ